MPRPRFARLPLERREAILDAAAAELSEHGFRGASYNRIIERAGLSKGAMYYYFDDKQDLYATVVGDAVDRMFDALEPVREVDGVDAFWAEIERITEATWARMMTEPRVLALMPAFLDPRAGDEATEAMAHVHARATQWVRDLLARGRAVGAVRDDLPDELLLAVTLAVGEAIDRWVAQQWLAHKDDPQPEAMAQPATIGTLVDLLRRVAAP